MDVGKLDKRITLQKLADGEDAYGQPAQIWTDVIRIWASIEDISGRQYFAAQAAQNPVETKITVRYRPGIAASMRAVHGSDVYDVHAVLGQGREVLELMCARGVNNG